MLIVKMENGTCLNGDRKDPGEAEDKGEKG